MLLVARFSVSVSIELLFSFIALIRGHFGRQTEEGLLFSLDSSSSHTFGKVDKY